MAKNPYINAYHNGVLISSGDESSPLNVGPLNASNNEISAPIAVEIKCEAGYKTVGDTSISFEGTTHAKWSACATSNGTYAPTLTISQEILEAGITVYFKAQATDDESPSNDTSVDIKIATTIAAV